MGRPKRWILVMSMVLVLATLAWGVGPGWAAQPANGNKNPPILKKGPIKPAQPVYKGKVTAAERKAAAKRAKAIGLKPGVAGAAAAATPVTGGVQGKANLTKAFGLGTGAGLLAATITNPGDPGGIPHYFGPYGNWAYSPLPRGPVAAVTLVDGGTGYTAPTCHHRRCLRDRLRRRCCYSNSRSRRCHYSHHRGLRRH